MEFDYDKSWDALTSIFSTKMTAINAWSKFIEFHEQTNPKPYWTRLKNLEIEIEQIDIVNWIENILKETPIPEKTIALWIGIIKFEENEKEIPAIYLIGADTYDKDKMEWACNPTYLPDNRYALSGLLKEIDEITINDKENYNFLDWILPLAYCTFTLDEIIRIKLDKKKILKNKKILNIAVGHDSGDYMNLTAIEQ
jgi:hypothetical protein